MVCGIRERKLLFSPPSQRFPPALLCVPLLSFIIKGPFLSFAAVSFIVAIIYAATLMMYSVVAWFLGQCIINGSQRQAALDGQLAAKWERETGDHVDYIYAATTSVFSLREITI